MSATLVTLWSWPVFGTIARMITRNGTLKRTPSTLLFQRLFVLRIIVEVRWNAAELFQTGTRTTLKSDHAAKTRRLTPAHMKNVAVTEPWLPQEAVNCASKIPSNCEIFSPMSSFRIVEVYCRCFVIIVTRFFTRLHLFFTRFHLFSPRFVKPC